MPTDKNTALRILVRKGSIEKKEWLSLIEARRTLIKGHLNTFTLPELGMLQCLKNGSWVDGTLNNRPLIEKLKVVSNDKKLSLKMQGIFHVQPRNKIKYDYPPNRGFPDGTMQIWGLARSGHWIIVKVDFIGSPGYKHRGREITKTVEIEKTDLATIIAKTGEKPIEIWKKLGEAVKEWTKRRKEFYEHALEISDTIQIENKALSLITFFPVFD